MITADDVAQIKKLRAKKYSCSKIAKELGISVSTVQRYGGQKPTVTTGNAAGQTALTPKILLEIFTSATIAFCLQEGHSVVATNAGVEEMEHSFHGLNNLFIQAMARDRNLRTKWLTEIQLKCSAAASLLDSGCDPFTEKDYIRADREYDERTGNMGKSGLPASQPQEQEVFSEKIWGEE